MLLDLIRLSPYKKWEFPDVTIQVSSGGINTDDANQLHHLFYLVTVLSLL